MSEEIQATEPELSGKIGPNSTTSDNDSSGSAADDQSSSHSNDAAKILVAAANHSSEHGDLDDDEQSRTSSDGLKNKFSKWKNKATSLYEDNNSIAKIKKMGNSLEVKAGLKMGIKMGSNALGTVVHAVMPHQKNSAEEGKAAKDKKSVKLADPSAHTVSMTTPTETVVNSSFQSAPMSNTLNSGFMDTAAVSSSKNNTSSSSSCSEDDDSDSDSTDSDNTHSNAAEGKIDLQTPLQAADAKRINTTRSETDLESLASPSASSPALIRGRYATPSSANVPQKKRSSLEQIQSGITSVATITTGIATMSAFTASGQTSVHGVSSSHPTVTHSSSDSTLNMPSFSNLPPGQYGVTIGPGMLGVHLKQSYWPAKGGIYIDSIVPGGHAEKSKIMMVGDTILKVGDVDVSKGTVAEVPKVIGRARRPVLLVCSGEFPVVEGDKVRFKQTKKNCIPTRQNKEGVHTMFYFLVGSHVDSIWNRK